MEVVVRLPDEIVTQLADAADMPRQLLEAFALENYLPVEGQGVLGGPAVESGGRPTESDGEGSGGEVTVLLSTGGNRGNGGK